MIIWCVSLSVFAQGHEIKISINCQSDTVLLGHYFAKRDGNSFYLSGTCTLDKKGRGVFKGENKLSKGVYFLVTKNQLLMDFVIGDNQSFEIIADTIDLVGTATAKNSRDNEMFFDYRRISRKTGLRQHELHQKLQTADSISKVEIYKELQALNLEHATNLWNMIEGSKGLYVQKYLNSQLPLMMRLPVADPHPWQASLPENAQTWSRDSLIMYSRWWYRSNFFSDFNIFDPDMLRNSSYEEKLMIYITKTIPQATDSICAEIDKILRKAQKNDEVFRCVLVILFNYYSQSKVVIYENITVHLVEKWYIPFSTWSSDESLESLKEFVANSKPRLFELAPAIEPLLILPPEHFRAAALDTAIKFDIYAGKVIHDFRKELKSKYTILYFWDYSCGHCKKGIQDLFHAWEELKDTYLQIITVQVVHTKEAKGKWIDFVNEHNMYSWINAWSPYAYSYENHYKETYHLSSTPKMFLLDENSTIILKNIGPEHLKEIIDNIIIPSL